MENKIYSRDEAYRILAEVNKSKKHANTRALTLMVGIMIFIALTWSVFQGLAAIESANGVAIFFLILFIAVYAIMAIGAIILCVLSLLAEPYAKIVKVNIPTEDHSIISYDRIANKDFTEFADSCTNATEEELINDYIKQIYLSSAVTKIKTKFFNIAAIMTSVLFFSTIVIIIMNNAVDWS